MTCAEAEAHFVDAADGRLDLSLEMRLAAHLDGCAACRARAASWRQLVPAMRALAPPGPDAMRIRRMQIEIERALAPGAPVAGAARGRWLPWPAALGMAVAAALALVWIRHPGGGAIAPHAAAPSYAVVARVAGDLTVDDGTDRSRPLAVASALAGDSRVVLAGAGAAELALGRDARLRLTGPTRVVLGGTARAIAVRLEAGTVEAEVAHRSPDETFAVITRELHVEVRGTRFSVGASATGSWVRVDEGRVDVGLADGNHRLVSAGETLAWPPAPPLASPVAPVVSAAATIAGDAVESLARGPSASCAEARRACESTARAARDRMRAGEHAQALRLLAGFSRERRGGHACAASSGESPAACVDELGYLRAEALRGAGRFDAAIDAYRGLDRRGSPPAMRQNALYAAAELEARRGHAARARADYERALAASPRGALVGESMLGAAESAQAAGDGAGAVSLARRYLDAFPAGAGVARARRIVGGRGP